MRFDNSLLYHFILDSLRPYSENFYMHDRQNPARFRLNGIEYSTQLSYVHDSGENRFNPDERRIQVSRSIIERQRARVNAGCKVAFIGFFPGGKTFVAWDPRHVFSLRASTVVSVYARQSQQQRAEENHVAIHSFRARYLRETSVAIALPSNALGFYLENIERFHRIHSESAIQSLMKNHTNAFIDFGLGSGGEIDFKYDGKREKLAYNRKVYPRDPSFKPKVLNAYSNTCCICNRQLGLVEAAHIIPHSTENCPNTVHNGLAMCVEHHRLYDAALLLPKPGQELYFNRIRAEYLRQTEQGEGLDEIEELSRNKYWIPSNPSLQPSDEYLQLGFDIRLGK